MKTDHDVIYLSPICDAERLWCEDDQGLCDCGEGHSWLKFIRSAKVDDDLSAAISERDAHREAARLSLVEIERLKVELAEAQKTLLLIANTEMWSDPSLQGWQKSPGDLREYAYNAALRITDYLPKIGGKIVSIFSTTRLTSHAETAAEMDRRGKVIERLEAELASLHSLDPVRLEAAASVLINLDEGMSPDDIFGKRIMSHKNRDAAHDGDCTKRPYTCCRCLYESELKRARETILAYLGKTEGE
jgi:hypothetical protein